MQLRLPLALLALVPAAACGGGATGPTPVPSGSTVARVQLSASSLDVPVGSVAPLTATPRDAAGHALAGRTVTWRSSAEVVATVSSSGMVTGRSAGTAMIVAAVDGRADSALVTVALRSVSSIVDSVRAAHGLIGLAGAVVTRAHGVTLFGAAGDRRIGGPPVSIDDRWHLGSNLKAMTAMLAAIGVTEGRLAWEATLGGAFPELSATMRPEYRDVTLRDLLAMRSGLVANPPSGTYVGATARAQREAAVAWAVASSPGASFGTYLYSNLGYLVAGAMIERALGGTYEELLVGRVGAPAGATGIGFGPTTAAGGTDQPVGHRWNGSRWEVCEACDNPPGLSSAGRAHMPMAAWGRIVQEMMRAHAGQSTLVSQAEASRLFTGLTPVPGSANTYALGWLMTTRSWGGLTATHSGSNTTNHSVAWVGLDSGVALLAATNGYDGTASSRTAAALDALVARLLRRHQAGQ